MQQRHRFTTEHFPCPKLGGTATIKRKFLEVGGLGIQGVGSRSLIGWDCESACVQCGVLGKGGTLDWKVCAHPDAQARK